MIMGAGPMNTNHFSDHSVNIITIDMQCCLLWNAILSNMAFKSLDPIQVRARIRFQKH